MRGVAIARIEFQCSVCQVGCVVPEALLGSAVGAQSEIPRRFAVHTGEPLDVLPGVRQRVTGPCERDRRRKYQQRDRVVGYAVEMIDECIGARLVALLTPGRDGLDMSSVFVVAVGQCRTRTGEMAADGIGAAG